MERSRIQELHYITDMANVGSILERGILSHRHAQRVASGHISVADAEVQARRASKRVWVGRSSRPLHDANLYVHARNAMLFTLLRSRKGDLTVLSVGPAVLELDGVVVADRNAASLASLFLPAAEGIAALDEGAVFAEWWTSSSEAKQLRMAEVLVPDHVPPSLIKGAYVPDRAADERLRNHLGGRSPATRVNPWLFFRSAP
jgi:hypothetical protein